MRRLTAWIGGVAGGVAAYRFFRRRPQVAPEPSAEPAPPPPEPAEPDERAEELRAKLAENRAVDEPPLVEPEEPPVAVDERRQRVHEEGRAALDEMKSEDAG
jgi:hypothetical protein